MEGIPDLNKQEEEGVNNPKERVKLYTRRDALSKIARIGVGLIAGTIINNELRRPSKQKDTTKKSPEKKVAGRNRWLLRDDPRNNPKPKPIPEDLLGPGTGSMDRQRKMAEEDHLEYIQDMARLKQRIETEGLIELDTDGKEKKTVSLK